MYIKSYFKKGVKNIYKSFVQFLLDCADAISMYQPSGPASFPGPPQTVENGTLASGCIEG